MLGSSIQVRIKWFLLNKFKKIICVNPDTKLFLEEKLTNVHNQVIPAFLPPTKIDKSSVSFIKDYCSKFDYVLSGYAYRFSFFEGEDLYGTDLMIDLIDRLTKKEINAVLVLLISMEETPYFGKITQKINNLNLEQNILLIDINKGVDAVALWQMSDIYLRPTNTDGNSISILEALSVGSSVVASDCVERPESCILFRNRDIEDFETVVTTSLQSKSHTYMAPDLSHLFFDLYEDIAQKTISSSYIKMIVIKLKGGLGNQMFQYALYKYFLNKYPNDRIRLDVSYFSQKHDLGEGVATRQCDILNFDVKISNPLISIPPVLNKIFGKTNFYHKETSDITFKPQILEKRHGIFDGYWQSEKYFEGIKDIIFKELVLKDNLDSYNQKTLDSIIETASVSIHVRRGDYLNLGLELTNWNKYYSDALTYINCRHKIEKVFVFFR